MAYTPPSRDLSLMQGKEDDNPVSLLTRRMKIALIAGAGTGIFVQSLKGGLNTPALFGRIAYSTIPMCGIGFYYLTGTYITGRIRKIDGAFNHLVGAYCTFPVLRKFLPLSYTVSTLFFISIPIYALIYSFKARESRLSFTLSYSYGIQMTGFNANMWLENMSSEPFVKRESYNLFTVPSK